jgi:hypothetical protein
MEFDFRDLAEESGSRTHWEPLSNPHLALEVSRTTGCASPPRWNTIAAGTVMAAIAWHVCLMAMTFCLDVLEIVRWALQTPIFHPRSCGRR